ncbi:RNA-directed DNA polymerase [Dokdonella soli]|uniref:RNA-directed DNA polymerase n=1 Tax=Dokdonella soli TaxID=529810 RepID=A0ABN1IUH7_9GAMM
MRGEASPVASNPDYAWIVNFNNGNANIYNRNNQCRVRAVRSVARASECQGATSVGFHELFLAWRCARKNKQPSANQLDFECRWTDRLLDLQERINAGRWSPSPTTCFVATRPKAREIHAPDFSDRVVHHWLMSRIEPAFEPGFIFDSYANRKGKGSHAAVDRLKGFVRQVASGQGGGWYLQLDIANYFNTIHRPTLWTILKRRMAKAGVPEVAQRVTHALLRKSPIEYGVVHRSTAQERAQIPLHKRLENSPAACGIPIGNLSSQFFANVYLNELDQFVKHELKAQRYIRYVDDFVIIHRDRAQLERWRDQIETFLRDRLRLKLKADQRLRSLTDGADFLGYVVFPTHTRVRTRVVRHARAALTEWAADHVRADAVRATPEDYRRLQSIAASYDGHFTHANAHRLSEQFNKRFPWLAAARTPRRFRLRDEGRYSAILRDATNYEDAA